MELLTEALSTLLLLYPFDLLLILAIYFSFHQKMLNPPDSGSQSQNRSGGGVEFYLSDAVAIEILSRLPAIDVVRLRLVCKRWRDLTSSQHFAFLHLQNHRVPMVLFQEHIGDGSDSCLSNHYLLDQWWEPPLLTRYEFGDLSEFDLLFSHGGLIVMENLPIRTYRIMNPIYHEIVQITFSEGVRIDDLCGIFFHPSLKEHCTLWRIALPGESIETEIYEYKILNLGSKPCWREINNPWSQIDRVRSLPPILIDEHLYWVVKPEPDSNFNFTPDIMEFDIRKEEFTFIPSPVPRAYKCNGNINLLDNGGLLSLVCTPGFEGPPSNMPFEVKIWTLKNRARQLWTMSSYSIHGDGCSPCGRPITLVKNELFLRFGPLYICNLRQGIARDIEYNCQAVAFFATHVMSLVSLRSCKSEIYMDIGQKW